MHIFGEFFSALSNLDRQHIGIAQERDPVYALGDRFNDVQHSGPINPAIFANVDMVMKRERLMSARAYYLSYLTLRAERNGMTSRENPDTRGPVP